MSADWLPAARAITGVADVVTVLERPRSATVTVVVVVVAAAAVVVPSVVVVVMILVNAAVVVDDVGMVLRQPRPHVQVESYGHI